ncbi:hypothetical protein [Vibrio sp. D431a]|uniref:hypothetical protein n=1 Tax=Vibrio sp. D431a TaxID=2837388 RepID=UPI0025530EF9|nr:hypothetical protein [Vibrio sp. D431a]MDK9790640.1 hypothetical protein [Vibrio sp. D431a]
MRVLTKVALGALINRSPKGINMFLEEKHMQYLSGEVIGSPQVWDSEFLHYNHGAPCEIELWLKQFGIEKGFDPAAKYVVASVLDLVVKFMKDAKEKFFERDGGIFKRSLHENAFETNIDGLYQILLKGKPSEIIQGYHDEHKNLKMYVSKDEIDLNTFESPIESSYVMDLHLPDASAEVEEEISIFKGMKVDYHGDMTSVGSAGVITKFKIDSKGAEAKQAAYMTLYACGAVAEPIPKRTRRIEVIDGNYFVYITFNDQLAFAVEIEPTDFIEGEGEVQFYESKEPSLVYPENCTTIEELYNL